MLNTIFVFEIFSFDAVLYFLHYLIISYIQKKIQLVFSLVFFISLPYYPTFSIIRPSISPV
jgi:hypothetical protein